MRSYSPSCQYFYEDIHYLNSGDWVETLSALTEDEDGNWTIRYFDSGLLKEDNHKEKTNYIHNNSIMKFLFIVQGEGEGISPRPLPLKTCYYVTGTR